MVYGATGDVYMGQYLNDKRNGKGRYDWKSTGNTYDGEWVLDERTG